MSKSKEYPKYKGIPGFGLILNRVSTFKIHARLSMVRLRKEALPCSLRSRGS
jgi:hypothetical protein